MPQTSRKRSRTTYAGRIVYDRPTHYFKVKDVIRIARKADPAETPIDMIFELLSVNIILARNAFRTVFLNPYQLSRALNGFLQFLDEVVQTMQLVFAGYTIKVWEELLAWIWSRFGAKVPK